MGSVVESMKKRVVIVESRTYRSVGYVGIGTYARDGAEEDNSHLTLAFAAA
jgi:hypothetical protein